jgi:hypothetical protein
MRVRSRFLGTMRSLSDVGSREGSDHTAAKLLRRRVMELPCYRRHLGSVPSRPRSCEGRKINSTIL